jgi:hypothetical protein
MPCLKCRSVCLLHCHLLGWLPCVGTLI